MEEKLSFSRTSALGQTLFLWWQNLDNHRGDRAELRRASNLTAIALTPGFQRFYRNMREHGWPDKANEWQKERLAVIAGVLAHVRGWDELAFPEIALQGDKVGLSELRFRRLLESPSLDDLFVGLRRALPLVNHKLNGNKLAEDILHWGDRVRKEWAYRYPWPTQTTN